MQYSPVGWRTHRRREVGELTGVVERLVLLACQLIDLRPSIYYMTGCSHRLSLLELNQTKRRVLLGFITTSIKII